MLEVPKWRIVLCYCPRKGPHLSPSSAVCFELVHPTQASVGSAQCVAACLGSKNVSGERATKIKLTNLVPGPALTGWGSFPPKKRAKDPIHMLSIFPFSFHVSLKAKLIRQPSAGYK